MTEIRKRRHGFALSRPPRSHPLRLREHMLQDATAKMLTFADSVSAEACGSCLRRGGHDPCHRAGWTVGNMIHDKCGEGGHSLRVL